MQTMDAETLPVWQRNGTIVVYCASAACRRAGLSAERLEQLGYTQVFHFVGRKRNWVSAGFPLA